MIPRIELTQLPSASKMQDPVSIISFSSEYTAKELNNYVEPIIPSRAQSLIFTRREQMVCSISFLHLQHSLDIWSISTPRATDHQSPRVWRSSEQTWGTRDPPSSEVCVKLAKIIKMLKKRLNIVLLRSILLLKLMFVIVFSQQLRAEDLIHSFSSIALKQYFLW